MEIIDTSKLLFGISWTLVGTGIIFAKINAEDLRLKSRITPGLSLFRIPAFKWSVVIILLTGGILFIFQSIVWNY